MAGPISDDDSTWEGNMSNFEEQNNEIEAIKSFYENTDNLEIIQEASIEEHRLFNLQFKVKLETKKKPCLLEIWLPVEKLKKDELKEQKQNENVENKQKLLERSVSGHHAHTEFVCDYLLPLTFSVVLPPTYPSTTSPIFNISSNWLNKDQLSKLCSELDKMWNESFGIPIIYTWIEWLQSNTIEFLDIFEEPNKVIVTPLDDYEKESCDSRVSCTFNDVQTCIFEFIRFNYVEELKDFQMSLQTCGLCFDEKYGKEFYHLNNCRHRFCIDCMISYCQMHVKDGTIQYLKCPESDCDQEVPDDILRLVLSKEDYERWERLLLQRTLDSMSDLMYCPKCNIPILLDGQNDTHAYCMNCNIDFCSNCKDFWHVGPCDTEEQKIQNKIKDLKLTPEKLLEMTDEQIKQQFKHADFVIKLREKTAKNSDAAKDKLILSKYRSCPKCRAPIDKYEGCNKVVCICGTILCYVCGRQISGYEHFNQPTSKCNLWAYGNDPNNIAGRVVERQMHQGQQAVNRILELLPDQRRNSVNCVTCGQLCLKMENNNHIRCWLCFTNFCFSCKKRIQGVVTAHYRMGSTCKQHSN